MSATPPPEDAAPVQTWKHSRKGRIVGRVVEQDKTWTKVLCTERNSQAEVGEVITFRTELAREVTS